MPKRWYSVNETAEHGGISREAGCLWIDHRGLPAHLIGKFWKLRVSEDDWWARVRGVGPEGHDSPTAREGDGRV